MPAGALPLDPSRGSAPLSTTFLFRKRNNENFERDVARPDIISFEVEPLTKRSQGKVLLSAAPLAPREKSEIFPAGTPYEISKCRTEGIACKVPHRRYSDCYTKCQSRWADVKCASNAPFSSRSGRIASGITWRRRGGAVLGRPHARVPKVSPEMVGSLLRGNDFGGNPQEGGNNISIIEDSPLFRVGEESRRGGGGATFPARRTPYSNLRARRFLGFYSHPLTLSFR